jgi:hypothetical protein
LKNIFWLALPAALTSVTALAAQKVAKNDWTFSKSGETECRASTPLVKSNDRTGHLDLIFDPSGARPLEIQMSLQNTGGSPNFPGAYTVVLGSDKLSTYYMAQLAVSETESHDAEVKYWSIPQNTRDLMAYIIPASEIKMKQGSETLTFSLIGISKTLERMRTECNAGQKLLDPSFESEFLTSKIKVLNADTLRPSVVSNMRALYWVGYAQKAKLNALTKQQSDLAKQYANLLAQKSNQDKLSQANQAALAKLSSRREDLEQTVAQLAIQLEDTSSQIDSLIADQVTAQRKYDETAAALNTIQPQYENLNSQVELSQIQLQRAEASLQQGRNTIDTLRNEIAVLQQQQRDLEAANGESRRKISEGQAQKARLESEARNLDVSAEVRNALARDGYFQSSLRIFGDIQDEMKRVHQDLSQYRQPLQTLQETAEKWGCLEDQNHSDRRSGRRGQDFGDDDDDDRDFSGGRNSTSSDCARLRDQARPFLQGRMLLIRDKSYLTELMTAYQSYFENSRRAVEQQVVSYKQGLIDNAAWYARQDIEERNAISGRTNEISIVIQKITSERVLLSNVQNVESVSLESLRDQKAADVRSAKVNLSQYVNQTSYDTVNADYSSAKEDLDRINDQLQSAESSRTVVSKRIEKNKKEQDTVNGNIEQLMGEIANQESQSLELQGLLAPYFNTKTDLDQKSEQSRKDYGATTANFNGLFQ